MPEQVNPLMDKCAEAAAVCACVNFRKAARAVTQFFDGVLHPSGLRATQFVILVGVAVYESRPISQLARELVIDRTTLTRNLRPLVAKRLVRTLLSKDRRMRVVSLTDRGREILVETMPLWEDAQQRIVKHFGPQEWDELIKQVSKVVLAARSA